LDEDSFYQRYFQQRGVPDHIPIRVRRILEQELGVDLSRLAAKDDFTTNLKFFWDLDSLADAAIVRRLEEEFGIAIADEELQYTRTVSDIIELVWSKLCENC
jgi:acyl carrier protein